MLVLPSVGLLVGFPTIQDTSGLFRSLLVGSPLVLILPIGHPHQIQNRPQTPTARMGFTAVSSDCCVSFFFCLGRPCGPALLLCFFVLVWCGPLGQLCCLCLFCFFCLDVDRNGERTSCTAFIGSIRTSLQSPTSCKCYYVIQNSYGSIFSLLY